MPTPLSPLASPGPVRPVLHRAPDETGDDAARARGRGLRVRDGPPVRLQPQAADLQPGRQEGTPHGKVHVGKPQESADAEGENITFFVV